MTFSFRFLRFPVVGFLFLIIVSGNLKSEAQIVINEVFINPAQDSVNPQYQSLAYCADSSFGYEWIEI